MEAADHNGVRCFEQKGKQRVPASPGGRLGDLATNGVVRDGISLRRGVDEAENRADWTENPGNVSSCG